MGFYQITKKYLALLDKQHRDFLIIYISKLSTYVVLPKLQHYKYVIKMSQKAFNSVLQSHKVLSKSDQKQKNFINRTFFVNKQLTLFFNFLQNPSLNFAQNFRECSFNLAGSESGEKSKRTQFFVYISQLFVYKTRLWTQLRNRSR